MVADDLPHLTDSELIHLAEHIKSETGIALDSSKRYLFESRLGPLLHEFNLRGFGDLLRIVTGNSHSSENRALVGAITTNETYFFRDEHPFDLFKNKLIPDLLGENQSASVRIASAACSSGQEAYSLAMVLKEILFDLTKFNVQIKAFDVSDDIIAVASRAQYSKFEVQRGLSDDKIQRYFDCIEGRYHLKQELRSIVSFARQNVLKCNGQMGKFHIIFCRNVVNYFSAQDRALLFVNLADMLLPKGVLVIGATEFLKDSEGHFEKKIERGSVYYEKRG